VTLDGPLNLCDGATHVLTRDPASLAHRRGAAFLARQSIEGTIRAMLGRHDADRMRWKSRFMLAEELHPGADARRGHRLWVAWSEICHYHPYDLVPGAVVLTDRIATTRTWVAQALAHIVIGATHD
jgi:hypothetical protein